MTRGAPGAARYSKWRRSQWRRVDTGPRQGRVCGSAGVLDCRRQPRHALEIRGPLVGPEVREPGGGWIVGQHRTQAAREPLHVADDREGRGPGQHGRVLAPEGRADAVASPAGLAEHGAARSPDLVAGSANQTSASSPSHLSGADSGPQGRMPPVPRSAPCALQLGPREGRESRIFPIRTGHRHGPRSGSPRWQSTPPGVYFRPTLRAASRRG